MTKKIIYIFLGVFLFISVEIYSNPIDGNKLVSIEVLSDFDRISPGLDFNLFFKLIPEKDWHTYWINPGDAGLATTFDFELPNGLTALDPVWETPTKIPFAGMANYGYEGESVVMIPFRSDRSIPIGQLNIKATVKWLACKEECIPGMKKIEFLLKVAQSPELNFEIVTLKTEFLKKKSFDMFNIPVKAKIEKDRILMEFKTSDMSDDVKKIEFFPFEQGYVDNGANQTLSKKNNKFELLIKLDKFRESDPKKIKGILVGDKPILNGLPNLSVIIEVDIN